MSARRALPALLCAAIALASAPAAAGAEACPGAGAGPCPYVSSAIIGRRAEGVLRFPEAVAVDTAGNVYVADQLSYVVQKFSAAGSFEAEWGNYGAGHGQFGPISGLATDSAGNVYVVDPSHSRIEKFDSSGNFITAWGHKGGALGAFDFGSSQDYTKPPGGGIAVAGQFVYVADSGNDRVQRFNLDGEEPLAWGTYGGGPGQFSYPRGIAANESEVLVSDGNHRVQRFDPNGNFLGEAGSAGSGPGQFAYAYGVTLDAAGDVYVADDLNHRVVKLSPQLGFLGAWGGLGSGPGQLAFPRALASDPAGDTYVADTANDRVEVFDPSGNYLRTLGIPARQAGQLTAPRGLALDPAGRLLAADLDSNRVEVLATEDESVLSQWTEAGGSRPGLFAPEGVGVDPAGPVYVLDEGGARLVRYWGDGTFLSELGGPADIGGAQLSGARSVAVDPATHVVYVADTGHNRILSYTPAGTLIARWGAAGGDGAAGSGPGEFDRPEAVAVAPSGEIYVADTANNRVVALSPAGAVITQWGGRGAGDGRFRSPTGVAVDGAGRVYVVDSENNRVEMFASGGQLLGKWGVRGTDFGDFSQPSAVTVGCEGDVYVADTNNNRIELFQPEAAAGRGCLAASAWPPPLDVAPVVSVAVPRPSGVLARRSLALSLSCRRGCKVLVTATLAPFGRPRGVPLIAAARSLPASLPGHVRLRLGPASLARLRRALGHGRVLSARVRVVAAGPTGRRTTVTKLFIVAR